ncbi:MAG: prepilin-type N-terminal cleavage/methylation domain-containing protein [Armatimonadetes bacterium]|nr:prepilin-type N-terminal cleavage/methylation domain-containing protein [Armatimonadota bacterium]
MNQPKTYRRFAARRGNRGFNLIEVLVAVFILAAMAFMFAAVIPTTLRSVNTSKYYNLAATIAQRKLDQLVDPAVGYKNLTPSGLGGTVLTNATTAGACDWNDPAPSITAGTAPNGVAPAKTNYRMVGYFTRIDGLRQYKENGTDACRALYSQNSLPGGDDVVGKLDIEGWQGKTATATDAALLKATVTISWRVSGRPVSTYTTSTLISRVSP